MLQVAAKQHVISTHSRDEVTHITKVCVKAAPRRAQELDQLEAVDYLREAQAGEPSFCREFTLSDAPETRMIGEGTFRISTKGIILSIVLTGQAVFSGF
jgi:hypothetical protein